MRIAALSLITLAITSGLLQAEEETIHWRICNLLEVDGKKFLDPFAPRAMSDPFRASVFVAKAAFQFLKVRIQRPHNEPGKIVIIISDKDGKEVVRKELMPGDTIGTILFQYPTDISKINALLAYCRVPKAQARAVGDAHTEADPGGAPQRSPPPVPDRPAPPSDQPPSPPPTPKG